MVGASQLLGVGVTRKYRLLDPGVGGVRKNDTLLDFLQHFMQMSAKN